MTGQQLPNRQGFTPRNQKRLSDRDIPKAQETIYGFLLEIVKIWPAEDVLTEFKHLFIHHSNTVSSETLPSLYEIVFANQEFEFRNTIKRSCYILINNWDITRNHQSIQTLIQSFDDPIIHKNTLSPTLQRLRHWLRSFIASKDFEELKLFAARYDNSEPKHWSERYTSYLLVPQYIDLNNPLEQRQAARALSRKLKEKFKFDLAMYTARSQTTVAKEELPPNPTALGDEVLRLIKAIVARRGMFSYPNLANIFVKQIQNLTYKDFKESLKKYLVFSVEQKHSAQTLQNQLAEKLDLLYVNHHDKTVDEALLLRTCNRVIEYLTTEDHSTPSPLFASLMSQGNPLTLSVVLLKIILICRNAHTHLEARIADLIMYYNTAPEDECQWIVNFFELFRIMMAIYTENVEFNLVNMNEQIAHSSGSSNVQAAIASTSQLDAYRIFSQPRVDLLEADQEPDPNAWVEAPLETSDD
ncbi:MAG TPA: hypothetical protein V6C88_12700 [Chroococcidiopsis sp.]